MTRVISFGGLLLLASATTALPSTDQTARSDGIIALSEELQSALSLLEEHAEPELVLAWPRPKFDLPQTPALEPAHPVAAARSSTGFRIHPAESVPLVLMLTSMAFCVLLIRRSRRTRA